MRTKAALVEEFRMCRRLLLVCFCLLLGHGLLRNRLVIYLSFGSGTNDLPNVEPFGLQSHAEFVQGIPRLGIHLGVFNRHREFHDVMVHAMPSFGDLQFVAMGPAHVIDPGSFIQAYRFRNKRVVIRPLADGVAIPARLQDFFGEFPAVHPNIAPDLIILVDDGDLALGLEDLNSSQVEKLKARESDWIANIKWIVILRDGNGGGSESRLMLLPSLQTQRSER